MRRFTLAPPESPKSIDDARAIYASHRLNELEPGFQHADRIHEALGLALREIDRLNAKEAS